MVSKDPLATAFTKNHTRIVKGIAVLMLLFHHLFNDYPDVYKRQVFLYVVSVSVRSSIKYLICGFFYSDFHRLAAVASIFAVPLICLGIDAVIEASESYAVLIGQKLEKLSLIHI